MSEAGALVGALGVVLALLSRTRVGLLAGFALLALAEAGLALDGGSVGSVRASTIAAGVAGVAVLGAAVWLLLRFPVVLAPALLVAAPLRLPFGLEGGGLELAPEGQLGRLVPLYFVLGAGVLALVWRLLRGMEPWPLPRVFALPAAGFVAFTASSQLWAADAEKAADLLLFFWLPFAALVATLARWRFDARVTRLLAVSLVAEAGVFAAIGIGQAMTNEVFFYTAKLESANAFGPLFRVTSMFDDPSHYGRFLVLGMAVLLVALWLDSLRTAAAAPLLALLAAGLLVSYSQSSFVTLAVVALALALVAGDRFGRLLVAGTVVVVAALGLVALATIGRGVSEDSFTSDRSKLVTDTAEVIAEHPAVGVGLGSQPIASRDAAEVGGKPRLFTSHTTPLTVAAEGGLIGFALYAAMLYGAARVIAAVRRRRASLGLGLAAVLLVLFVHSLFYSGFFDNPITWGVFGIAAAAVAGAVPAHQRPLAMRRSPNGRLSRILHGSPRRDEVLERG
jgi:O-antigen ligase